MNSPLFDYMRVGLVHFMAYPDCMRGDGPIVETVSKIAEDPFFNAIELTWVRDAAVRAKVREILDISQMKVAYAAQPAVLVNKLNLNSFSEDERYKALQELRERVDEAVLLGADSMALLSGPDPGEEMREDAITLFASSLQELCDYAFTKGVNITLETFDRTIDKKALIGPSDDAVRLAELVNRNNFGLMLDLSHLPLQFESTYKALHTAQNFLVHAHIGNCVLNDRNHPAYGDQHPHFGIEGGENGVTELTEFLQVLIDIGYLREKAPEKPIVSFEVKPLPGQSSELVIGNAKRTLLEAWARL